jgi:hypothetical protein
VPSPVIDELRQRIERLEAPRTGGTRLRSALTRSTGCFPTAVWRSARCTKSPAAAMAPCTASRRLQLAAESSGTIGIAIRRWRSQTEAADFGQPTAAVTRWRVTALPSEALPVPGIRRARWQVELIRCRAGESAHFVVEACDAEGRIALAADLVDRPVAAEARLSLSISTFILLASGRGNPWVAPVVPAANTGQGFGIVGAEAFPRVPSPCAQKRLGGSPLPPITTFALNARAADRARSF